MGKIGIIVSGGPAPGINSVIASVVFNGAAQGYEAIGFQGGFAGLVEDPQSAEVLTKEKVLPLANTGGSMLGTARFNPFNDKAATDIFRNKLAENNIDKLVIIGGEGSANISLTISQTFSGIQVAHIPKTIDNDLDLPHHYPSFGFETARFSGTRLLRTLMADAKTTKRWFVIKTMGRKAGFLALGLAIASSADLVLIPEQFPEKVTLDHVSNMIMDLVKNRAANGYHYGCVVIAEGLMDRIEPSSISQLKELPHDDLGRLMFADVALEDILVQELRKQNSIQNLKFQFSPENIGYVLRCRHPVPFDIEYTRLLGYGAIKFLKAGLSGIMVAKDFDKLIAVNLADLTNGNGKIRSRQVDLDSDIYLTARSFMNR